MKVLQINGQRVCWATNFEHKNLTNNARSRVLHLEHISKDRYKFPATQCGKLIVKFETREGTGRSLCFQCELQSEQWRNKMKEELSNGKH